MQHLVASSSVVESVKADLKALRTDVGALALLAFELGTTLDAVLEKVRAVISAPAPLPIVTVSDLSKDLMQKVALNWIAEVSQAKLRRAILQARGETAAANLVSRLNDELVELGHARPRLGKNGHAAGNGNGVRADL